MQQSILVQDDIYFVKIDSNIKDNGNHPTEQFIMVYCILASFKDAKIIDQAIPVSSGMSK